MVRNLLIAAVVAGVAVTSASAASTQISAQSILMPGVGYQRQVEFTPRGPVVLDVVTAPRPDGSLYTLAPALSNYAIVGTEKLTDIEKDVSATVTTVGVNGDFFTADPGTPAGILIRGGTLDSAPATNRSSLGIGADGTLTVAKVAFDGTWKGTDQRRQLDLNAKPAKGHTTLYTSSWGQVTPVEAGVVEDVIQSLPPTRPNGVVSGVVTQVVAQGGTPIPGGGAVLVSRGTQAPHLTAEAPAGTTVQVRLTLTPNWSAMTQAIGGGPLLVSGGKAVFRTNEAFGAPILNNRGARSAVGQLSDGRILLVTVEGDSPAYSVGMTNYELAVALQRLGAVNAMALGNGSAAAMAFDGSLLTQPSTGGVEQPVSDALLLSYAGIYAAPPSASVLSPNGDGADDTQTLTYKLVRQSHVTATLVGPGSTLTLAADNEAPGLHVLQWFGQTAAGSAAPEGTWTFQVTGADDQGRTTIATRAFSLNDTLNLLTVTPTAAHLAAGTTAATATFQLIHPATVTATVETRTGIVIATPFNGKLVPGPQQIQWDGQSGTGGLAFTGAYQMHIVATNSIGTVSLIAPFTARRS